MVHPLGAGARGPFAAALPFAQAWGMRITRWKLNSQAMYVPSSASIGMMRTGRSSSANRGSLTTSRICCRSCGIRACAGGSLTASGRRLPAPHQAASAERCARRSLRPDRRPPAEHRRPGLLDGGNELLAICQRDHPSLRPERSPRPFLTAPTALRSRRAPGPCAAPPSSPRGWREAAGQSAGD